MTSKYILTLLALAVWTFSYSKRHEGEVKPGLLSHFVSITDNEDKGIKDIVGFYGGECLYSIGFVKSTKKEEDKKYFKMELSKSGVFAKYSDRPEWITSNMAYRFYKNLNDKEKQNYTHIRCTIIFDNGDKVKHDYSMDELEMFNRKYTTVIKVIETIKEKRFQDIKEYLNPQNLFPYHKDSLAINLEMFDKQFGDIQEFRLFGFKYTTVERKDILGIFGVLIRDNQNCEFKVYTDLKADKDDILIVDYKW
jgi:hypothetical protein